MLCLCFENEYLVVVSGSRGRFRVRVCSKQSVKHAWDVLVYFVAILMRMRICVKCVFIFMYIYTHENHLGYVEVGWGEQTHLHEKTGGRWSQAERAREREREKKNMRYRQTHCQAEENKHTMQRVRCEGWTQ